MIYPSATEIYQRLPRNQWFRIPVIVKFLYPELPSYVLQKMYSSVCNLMMTKIKWGTVERRHTEKRNIVFWCI